LKKKKNSNCSPTRQSTFNQYQYLNKVLNAESFKIIVSH